MHVNQLLSEQKEKSRSKKHGGDDEPEDEDETQDDVDDASDVSMSDAENQDDHDSSSSSSSSTPTQQETKRKRKRASKEDDLEDAYLSKLAERESRDQESKKLDAKRRKVVAPLGSDESSDNDDDNDDDEEKEDAGSDAEAAGSDSASDSDSEGAASPPPLHESISQEDKKDVVEQSRRTVFISNVSIEVIRSKSAKKTLMAHMSSFLSSLPKGDTPHKIESIRFRSVAFSDTSLPKRAAYAKKEIMDNTTHSTNAYVVYTTEVAARKAPAILNGTVVLDRHLRVDSVAHPAPVDHKRCVFVGNLAFVDKENPKDDEEDNNKKKRKKDTPPADVEEGLWRTFNQHCKTHDTTPTNGPVESVRVIRDRNTRIGKGFAYVQFYNPNSVESALTLNGKKFPPMLPRELRVSRAKNVVKKPAAAAAARTVPLAKGRGAQQMATFQGRATRLLGRAGAKLQERKAAVTGAEGGKVFVFEGHRASEKGGDRLKMKVKSRGAKGKGKSKTGGKPKDRSAKRAAAYKAKMGYK